ncbi:hypothetical protein [Halochromatium glycolicum]|uniref:Uncharacterized protein n=1 Tax=Halochromatium glycolicum TaxID=85075 RepID=A0AAJ0U270_9GAMM|nr:hypothetical protein [Halochromatium glycolicum]MBK1703919.1 hypothetical protein [Halochromatium glycolicum]
MSLFLRLLEADDKAVALREVVQAVRGGQPDARVFEVDPQGFRQVPGAPFAYWVSDRVLFSFVEFSAFSAEGRSAVSGGKTLEDDESKWQPVKVPQAKIDQLIAERTSAAVKAALQGLLDAPPPAEAADDAHRAAAQRAARAARQAARAPEHRRPTDPAVMDSIKQAVAAVADGASKAEILASTGLSDAQWNTAIAALLADRSVTKSGSGRGTRYHRKTDD